MERRRTRRKRREEGEEERHTQWKPGMFPTFTAGNGIAQYSVDNNNCHVATRHYKKRQ